MSWLRTFLEQFRLTYFVYNSLHRKQLRKNKEAYKKYGLQRNECASLSYELLKDLPGEPPWLDRKSLVEIASGEPGFQTLPSTLQDGILHWSEDGYAILPGLFTPLEVDQINDEIERLLREGTLRWQYGGRKLMFAYRHSERIRNILSKPELQQVLSFLLGKPVTLFSSINFYQGSEQLAHSDSIHMSTHPEGYLIAAWLALEDIHPGSGPLTYYPGSHKLPYIHSRDFGGSGNAFLMDAHPYDKYENYLQSIMEAHDFKTHTFLPQKGDVLLWHANLLHGGSPVTDPGQSRKSMVLHYYAQDVICYHEISQRPTLWP